MLCQPLDEKNLDRNFKAFHLMLAQPKLDGMRCWVQWVDHEPLLWSSEGNLITGVPHISLLLKDWAKKCGELPFDGELYNHTKKFEDIISITKRGGDNLRDDFTDVQYHVFDHKGEGMNAKRYGVLREAFKAMPEDVRKEDTFKMVPTSPVTRLLPTHVGVFPTWRTATMLLPPPPHARGGVSISVGPFPLLSNSSPRTWGCFALLQSTRLLHRLLPTHVGVFPQSQVSSPQR